MGTARTFPCGRTAQGGMSAQLVAMAKRSKALEDRLRESEAREKRAREDAQVNLSLSSLSLQHVDFLLVYDHPAEQADAPLGLTAANASI